MGTNYYLATGRKERRRCDLGHTHLVPERYHIGKSSYGRYFSLHVAEVKGGAVLRSLRDWREYAASRIAKGGWIEDEYGRRVSEEEMWRIVAREGWEGKPGWEGCADVGEPFVPGMWRSPGGRWYDEYGERGLIKTHGLPVGEDGLYVLMEGDFS